MGLDEFQVLNGAPDYTYESTASNPAFRAAGVRDDQQFV